jgi:hypothetical protein
VATKKKIYLGQRGNLWPIVAIIWHSNGNGAYAIAGIVREIPLCRGYIHSVLKAQA